MSSKIYTSVLVALLLFSTSSVFAEVETTSSLRGVVNVAGAVVSATHTPTGTSKTRSASAEGAFYLSDLQIGGPYDISVSAPGYRTESLGGIYLVLDKTTDVTVTLVSSDIEEITVTAAASQGSIRMGTGTFLDRDAIDGIPTVNRSIADIAKLDPRVSINTGSSRYSEISVMGANNRFNDFTIDGVSYNDPFGLNANGFGSMRNPIGMEFIDQISVDVTPFDVSRGNTTGGSIASVTKSGSNEFHGSVFFIQRDEDDIGDAPDGSEFPEFSEETQGFTFSGPIIKDRLFFFVGYEDFEAASPALYGTVDSNAPIKAETLTTAMADEIKSIAMSRYNYDPGEISSFSLPETSEKTIIKLNANITDDHRAVLLYQKDEDLYPRKYNRGETVFSNNWYLKPPEIDRVTFSLFSDWSDRLSTNIRFTNYELVEDDHSVGDPYFPESAISVGNDTVYLGGDRYRGANFINIESDYVNFKATYDLGNHVITAGIDLEDTSVYNLFIARYNGEVRFSSIADFEAGTYNYVRFHVPQTGISDVDNVAAMFDIEKTSVFLQDKIYLGDAVLSVGLRYDAVETPDKPMLNEKFLERNGYPNNAAFDYDTIQPRFGFNWDATERLFGDRDRIASATLRGGYGLFAGRIPNVWYSNAYTRSGGLSDYVKVYGWDDQLPSFRCGNVGDGTVGPMPAGDPSFFWMGPGSNYCIPSSAYFNDAQGTDPDFEAPSSWRMNLALDLVTAKGYEITVEYNHDDVDQAVFYHDAGLALTGYLADGRGTYYGKGDYIMTNTDKGGAEAYTFSVRKSFDNGFSFYSAYSSVDAKDVYPLTSSQAESAYGYTQRWDGENLDATRSSFMSDSKFIAVLEYRTQLWGDNETRISAVYIKKAGEPYSVSFDEPGYNSVTGNSKFYADYSLAYIPNGADDTNVVFSSASVASDVMAHINSTALAKYKGTYAPRNAFTNPDYDRLDVRITQEIPAFRDHKFIFYVDLLNVMNMLDDEDGRVFEYGYNNSRQIIVSGTDSDGRFLISGLDDDDSLYLQDGDGQSRWQVQMGLKYRF